MAAPTASVNFNNQNITGLAAPVDPTNAATKAYVDSVQQGLDVKESVRVATTTALPANTRTGNSLTADANGALPAIDGITLSAGDFLLVKDESTGLKNGIYELNVGGTGGSPWSMTRREDADSSAEVTSGMFVFVSEGTANADSGWVLTTNDPITLNTTALAFTQFSGAGQITAGNGLTKTGNTLDVNVDNTSLEISGDALRVRVAGIDGSMIADEVVELDNHVTGVLPEANGGTGESTYTDGQLLIGNSSNSGLTKATLTQGSGITITNGNGSIEIAATGSTGYQRATTVSGTQDSANKTFTIGNAVSAGSEQVFLNGQLLTPGASNDYVISGTTVTFQAAIDAPAATDVIRCYGTY